MAPLAVKSHHIPNLITSLRIVLVAPFLWLLLEARYGAALLLFAIAGISDALDGFLAKHYGWTSELGGILDPIADKLLLLGAILTLGWLNELPIWLVVLILARDILIVGGAISYHFVIAPFQAAPLMISKLNTLMQRRARQPPPRSTKPSPPFAPPPESAGRQRPPAPPVRSTSPEQRWRCASARSAHRAGQ